LVKKVQTTQFSEKSSNAKIAVTGQTWMHALISRSGTA
jgi:hypothetical protein